MKFEVVSKEEFDKRKNRVQEKEDEKKIKKKLGELGYL